MNPEKGGSHWLTLSKMELNSANEIKIYLLDIYQYELS